MRAMAPIGSKGSKVIGTKVYRKEKEVKKEGQWNPPIQILRRAKASKSRNWWCSNTVGRRIICSRLTKSMSVKFRSFFQWSMTLASDRRAFVQLKYHLLNIWISAWINHHRRSSDWHVIHLFSENHLLGSACACTQMLSMPYSFTILTR